MGWQNFTGVPQSYPTGPAEAVNVVKTTMQDMKQQMATYMGKVDSVLTGLQGIDIESVNPAPDVKIERDAVDLQWTVQPLDTIDLGSLDTVVPVVPATAFTKVDTNLNMPTFDPGVTITLPTAPVPSNIAQPVRPNIDTSVSLPGKPVLIQPVLDAMNEIVIPSYTFPVLPTFDDAAPTFDTAAPNVMIQWDEPVYASENFDLMLSTVRRMIAGGTGLPDDVERSLFDKARAREDITARKAVDEAFGTFAARGFTMPPGMLAEQVNVALENNQLAVNSLSRDVYIKVADIHVENLRTAVQQGVAAENILYNIFNNATQRTFEVAKFTVESQLALYNAQVGLFNTYMSAYQIKATVFKTRLDAKLAEIEVYRAQLEGQKIISEINQQQVQVFLAKIQALNSQVEIYKAEMDGARVKSEVVRSQIEGYKADVSAFAEVVGADKVRFDAYKAQVDGEVAKVGIIDAKARVFSSMAGVESSKADIRIKAGQLDIEQAQAETARYAAQIDGVKATISSKLSKVEAQSRVIGLGIQNLSAQSDANRSKSEADIRIAEQQLQSNLAAAQNQIKLYEVSITKAIEEARIKIAGMQAAGTMAATLAGGAMAAQHVQASISSSSSESTSSATSRSESASENWQYTPTSTS